MATDIKAGQAVSFVYTAKQRNTGDWTGIVLAVDNETNKICVKWTNKNGSDLKCPQVQVNNDINVAPIIAEAKKSPAKKAPAKKAEVKAEAPAESEAK